MAMDNRAAFNRHRSAHWGAYTHFCKRVAERIGADVNAAALWGVLIDQIAKNDTPDLTYIGRLNKSGRRIWRFEIGGDAHFVVFDHELQCPITILTPDMATTTHRDLGYQKIDLGAYQ